MVEMVAGYALVAELERWDDFIDSSVNGTLFHTRRFLAYHGSKFSGQERFVAIRKGEACAALMSLAVTEDGRSARSPYGGSYGGLVLRQAPSYGEAASLIDALIAFLAGENISGISLVQPLACCSSVPLDTLIFAMLERGFRSTNRDISSVVDLSQSDSIDQLVTGRTRNMARKARSSGVMTQAGSLTQFWPLMMETFDRHGTQPTHSENELRWLLDHMSDRVSIDLATIDGEPVAGTLILKVNDRVLTTFYFCQNEKGQAAQALSMLVVELMERSRRDGIRFIDFGTSSHAMKPRPNIFRFKESFGAFGMFRETLEYRAQGQA